MGGENNNNLNWFLSWGWIVVVGIVALVIIAIVLYVVLKKINNKKEIEKSKKQNSTFLEIFGGESNIISCEARGSRLVLVLNDYSKLDEERLKQNGVTSLIKATNKVTLIVGEKSKELENFINEIKR